MSIQFLTRSNLQGNLTGFNRLLFTLLFPYYRFWTLINRWYMLVLCTMQWALEYLCSSSLTWTQHATYSLWDSPSSWGYRFLSTSMSFRCVLDTVPWIRIPHGYVPFPHNFFNSHSFSAYFLVRLALGWTTKFNPLPLIRFFFFFVWSAPVQQHPQCLLLLFNDRVLRGGDRAGHHPHPSCIQVRQGNVIDSQVQVLPQRSSQRGILLPAGLHKFFPPS